MIRFKSFTWASAVAGLFCVLAWGGFHLYAVTNPETSMCQITERVTFSTLIRYSIAY